MPKFVMIVGPQAVGKMTVGQELTKITNLKLLHKKNGEIFLRKMEANAIL